MSSAGIAIHRAGLVSSAGLSAPAACAAMRAKVKNPSESQFVDGSGERIIAHQVMLGVVANGVARVAAMAAMAIEECLSDQPQIDLSNVPLLLCVAERERPGREDFLDTRLMTEIQGVLGSVFSADSAVIAHGRASLAVALARARQLMAGNKADRVVLAAADSLLNSSTLDSYLRSDRLLTPENSNGFIPGEAAGALLLGRPAGGLELVCHGIGFGIEKAHIDSEQPLRADGLSAAIREALADAACGMEDIDFRIADLSGEHYYFKEATLALSRTLRRRKEQFDIWHPAECIGEVGAVAGFAALALANAACQKAYAPGHRVLVHTANDGGQRTAVVMRFGGA